MIIEQQVDKDKFFHSVNKLYLHHGGEDSKIKELGQSSYNIYDKMIQTDFGLNTRRKLKYG